MTVLMDAPPGGLPAGLTYREQLIALANVYSGYGDGYADDPDRPDPDVSRLEPAPDD